MSYKLFLVILIITVTSCSKLNKDWTPDNSTLLFMSNKDGNSEVYLKVPGEINWINLTNNDSTDNWAVWSPDGEKILFQSNRSGNLEIWVMNIDGSNLQQLTNSPEYDYLPSWTPDGKQITFTSWRQETPDEQKGPHIYIMNADGSEQRRLMQEDINTSTSISWHPSGDKFIFTRKSSNNEANLFTADINGNILKQITKTSAFTGAAEYSPDGEKLVYYEQQGNDSRIFLSDADGKNRIILINEGVNYYPHWSPDGKWITYSALVEGTNNNIDIFAVSVDKPSNRIKIAGTGKREAEGVWNPAE